MSAIDRCDQRVGLRVEAERRHALWLLEGLKLRRADVRRVELRWNRVAIEAEAAVADVQGYERSLQGLAGPECRVQRRVASGGAGGGRWYLE